MGLPLAVLGRLRVWFRQVTPTHSSILDFFPLSAAFLTGTIEGPHDKTFAVNFLRKFISGDFLWYLPRYRKWLVAFCYSSLFITRLRDGARTYHTFKFLVDNKSWIEHVSDSIIFNSKLWNPLNIRTIKAIPYSNVADYVVVMYPEPPKYNSVQALWKR